MKSGIPHHYLKPGEMYFAYTPVIVSTLLGSCVSVTMFHPKRQIGAICHGLLPTCRDSTICKCITDCENSARNMRCSIRIMFDNFRELGVLPQDLEIKIFGGSDMFHAETDEAERDGIGSKNISITIKLLQEAGAKISASDIGGKSGRKIYFNSHTGEVLLKRVKKNLFR